jgi:hypothetical protein
MLWKESKKGMKGEGLDDSWTIGIPLGHIIFHQASLDVSMVILLVNPTIPKFVTSMLGSFTKVVRKFG